MTMKWVNLEQKPCDLSTLGQWAEGNTYTAPIFISILSLFFKQNRRLSKYIQRCHNHIKILKTVASNYPPSKTSSLVPRLPPAQQSRNVQTPSSFSVSSRPELKRSQPAAPQWPSSKLDVVSTYSSNYRVTAQPWVHPQWLSGWLIS